MRKNIKIFRKKAGKRQRGVALMFVLGILAILLVIALLFAMQTTLNHKVAVASTQLQSAKFLAKSGLERALISVNASSMIPQIVSRGITVDGNREDDANQTYDWIWKLETGDVYAINDGYEIGDYKNEMDMHLYPTWSYVWDGRVTEPQKSPIVGRYAFVAITNTNKLDPNAIANHGNCIASDDGDECESNLFDHIRTGVSTSDIWFDTERLGAAQGLTPQMLKDKYREKKEADSAWNGWTDWDEFIGDFGAVDKTDPNYEKYKKDLRKFFSFQSEDPECFDYTGEKDVSGHVGMRAMAHRFNLWRTDWNEVTVDDLLKEPVMYYAVTDKTLQTDEDGKYTINSPDGTGIAWLYHWSDGGDWEDAELTKKQIAANIINYCAPAERAVVSDVEPANWSAENRPSYTGLKRTPYLNELEMTVNIMGDSQELSRDVVNGTKEIEFTYTGECRLALELADIFKERLSFDQEDAYKVKIQGGLTYEYALPTDSNTGNREWRTVEVDLTFEKDELSCDGQSPDDRYIVFNADLSLDDQMEARTVVLPINTDEKQFTAVNNVKFTPEIMILYWNDEPVDFQELDGDKYSNIEEKISAVSKEDGFNTHSPASFNYTCSFQTEDPRQNLKSVDWNFFSLFTVTENMPDQITSIGDRNYNKVEVDNASDSVQIVRDMVQINPSENDTEIADAERCEDVIWMGDGEEEHLSTAYIRHAEEGAAPIESLWEIGVIHRGSKWQTLNLTRAQADLVAKENGGALYKDGDGHILDQLKMTAAAHSPKKVNLISEYNSGMDENSIKNTVGYFALDALFRERETADSESGVYLRLKGTPQFLKDVSFPGEPAQIDETVVMQLQKEAGNFERRTDIYKAEELRAALTDNLSDTDAGREELIGRILNLTRVSHFVDDVTVLVLAQTIQEIDHGVQVFKNWNDDDTDSDVLNSEAREGVGFMNAGYRRYQQNRPGNFVKSSDSALNNLPCWITTTIGKYDNGADRITSEAKIRASVYYDENAPEGTNRWKIREYEYVD